MLEIFIPTQSLTDRQPPLHVTLLEVPQGSRMKCAEIRLEITGSPTNRAQFGQCVNRQPGQLRLSFGTWSRAFSSYTNDRVSLHRNFFGRLAGRANAHADKISAAEATICVAAYCNTGSKPRMGTSRFSNHTPNPCRAPMRWLTWLR
jgi:hypothetical protein